MSAGLDPRLREIIVCPACRSVLADADDELACTGCDLVYPVRDGIPVLLVDDARRAVGGVVGEDPR